MYINKVPRIVTQEWSCKSKPWQLDSTAKTTTTARHS